MTNGQRRPPRRLTQGELELWSVVTADVRPMRLRSAPPPPPKKNVFDVIEDVIEVAVPVVAAAKTVAKVTKKKGK